jgi:nitrite reductase/ring-hydroxylating ferredoxin subunit
MKRRDFLSKSCLMCGAAAVSVVAVTSLESCKTTESTSGSGAASEGLQVLNSQVRIPLAEMSALRLKTFKVKGLPKELLLVKNGETEFEAYLMRCPHAGGTVRAEDSDLVCALHGSRFDLKGKVTKGPSKEGLKSYLVSIEGKIVVVSVV